MDASALETKEANLVAARSRELAKKPLRGKFDLRLLQAIHRYLFGDLYEWAGQIRAVDISKNDNAFAHHAYIVSAADAIFDQLAAEKYLAGLDPDQFAFRTAYYLGEINALHPFREGNGRAQREFLSHLAQANGYYIAWQSISMDEMLHASIASFKGDSSGLAEILLKIVRTFPS